MESMKDYASRKNISYEAVRKQVKRYAEELEGHISKVDRVKYLDEFAVNFLDERRMSNPIVVQQLDKDEELEQLRNDKEMLLIQIASIQDQLLKEKDQVKLLQTEKIALLEDKNQTQTDLEQENHALLEENKKLLEELRKGQEALIELQNKKQPGLFARLFGKE